MVSDKVLSLIQKLVTAADKAKGGHLQVYHRVLTTKTPRPSDQAELFDAMLGLGRAVEDLLPDAELFSQINESRAILAGTPSSKVLLEQMAEFDRQTSEAACARKAAIDQSRDRVQTSTQERIALFEVNVEHDKELSALRNKKRELMSKIEAARELEARRAKLRNEAEKRFGPDAQAL